MTANLPVDLDRLREDVRLARERVRDLETLLALGERLYGGTDDAFTPASPLPDVMSSTTAPTADAPPARQGGPLTNFSTRDAMYSVFQQHANEVLMLETITEEMARLGWDNGSETPVSSVRVAVSRAMRSGDHRIQRVRLGHYAFIPEMPVVADENDLTPDDGNAGDESVAETAIGLQNPSRPAGGLLSAVSVRTAFANGNHAEEVA